MGGAKEECGIAAIYLKNLNLNNSIVPEAIYRILSHLRHRGQLSTGICVFSPQAPEKRTKVLKVKKEMGDVDDLFRLKNQVYFKEFMEHFKGIAGIGHNRYSTQPKEDYFEQIDEAQPFLRRHGRRRKRFALAFNGTITNKQQIEKEILNEDYILDTNVDTESIMHLISLSLNKYFEPDLNKKVDLFKVFEEVMKKLDGSYSLVSLFADGNLVVIRDQFGFKPLVFGETDEFIAFASESTALQGIGIEKFYDVEPGSCTIFDGKALQSRNFFPGHKKSHCHFEYVYFSKATSYIEGKSVNSVRKNLGKALAEIEPLKESIIKAPEDYVVVPIPNTAIPASESFANALGLYKNSAIELNSHKRGFINKGFFRGIIMGGKYSIISESIKGKKVILIEDSIVRGETSEKVIRMLRNAGAEEVHLRSTEPLIKCPCFYGIDFPSHKELIARMFGNLSDKEIAEAISKKIGADSLVFQDINGLIQAIGFPKEDLCLACLNGDYPTPCGKECALCSAKEGNVSL